MAFVIFDTEYTADKGYFEEGFCGWQNREIVQIAALKVGGNMEVSDSLCLYIKPLKHPVLSKYFTDLTGITTNYVQEHGISFPEAYKQFGTFVGKEPCYSHGWPGKDGDIADGVIMQETMSYYNLQDDSIDYRNIASWFREKYQKEGLNIASQSSGEIASLLGCQKELSALNLAPHNALYDVWSILLGLRKLGFCPEKV